VTAGRSRPSGCPSPATAARIMPPPSTGRFLGPAGPAGPAITAQAAPHTGSTPRPPHRKRRGRAAHGLVIMTQESPSSDSPQGVDASTSACFQWSLCAVLPSSSAVHARSPVTVLLHCMFSKLGPSTTSCMSQTTELSTVKWMSNVARSYLQEAFAASP